MRRIVVTLVALVLAIAAGSLFLAIGGLTLPGTRDLVLGVGLVQLLGALVDLAEGRPPDEFWNVLAVTVWILTMAVIVVPPVVTAVIGEVFGTESVVFYGGGSGAAAAALAWLGRTTEAVPGPEGSRLVLLVFLTGAVAGLVYWALAGRTAGRTAPPLPAPRR